MTTLDKAKSLIKYASFSEMVTGNKFLIRKDSVKKTEAAQLKEELEKHVEKFVIEKGL